jgi:hypothetical protein
MVVLAAHSAVHAQQFERRRPARVPLPEFSVGLNAGIDVNLQSGNWTKNTSMYVCENFKDGSGAGEAFGVEGVYNFSRYFAAMLRVNYNNYFATFVSQRGQIVLVDSAGIYEREHLWRPTLAYLTLEPVFNFAPVSRRVQFLLGPTFNFLLKKTYFQQEHIVTASGKPWTFPNGSDTYTIDGGTIQSTRRFIPGAQIGLAVEFQIARNYLFAPTLLAHFLFSPPTTDVQQWSVITFKLGVSMRYVTSFME